MSEHELWNEMGNLYFMSGAYEQAVHAYLRSIQMDSTYGRPYSNLAVAYVRQGKYDEAVKLFRRSLDLLADHREKAISWNRLGKVYRQLKDYEQAVIAFQCADELDPECKEGDEEPGQMLYASSDPSIALQASAAAPSNPGEPAASDPDETPPTSSPDMATAAWTIVELPQPEESASLEIDPEAPSLTNWTEANADQEDVEWSPIFAEEAEIFLPRAEAEDPEVEAAALEEEPLDQCRKSDDEQAPNGFCEPASIEPADRARAETQPLLYSGGQRASLSNAEHQESRYRQDVIVDVEERPAAAFIPVEQYEEQVDQAQEQSLQIESRDPVSGANSKESADLEAEIAKYKRVVQINDRNASAWDALGTLYKSAGSYRESILAHQQAISIDAGRASYHHHLGLAFAGAGRDEDAITAFQKVIELDPDHYLAHATLGGYYRKLGLEELAQKHIGKAMRYIYDSESEYNRACLEAICGNIDQAIALLRTALEKKQTYVEWIIHDPDLDFIREDSRFKQLISNYTR
ncbi:MAG TPA: tetratricopeptide repeat protein [Anaerolineales bacterium]|nr:tetratricopeptide repeat protein [Anaerolineales bacterium]